MLKIAFIFNQSSILSVFKVNKSKLTNVSGTVLMGVRLHREAPVSVGIVEVRGSDSSQKIKAFFMSSECIETHEKHQICIPWNSSHNLCSSRFWRLFSHHPRCRLHQQHSSRSSLLSRSIKSYVKSTEDTQQDQEKFNFKGFF